MRRVNYMLSLGKWLPLRDGLHALSERVCAKPIAIPPLANFNARFNHGHDVGGLPQAARAIITARPATAPPVARATNCRGASPLLEVDGHGAQLSTGGRHSEL